MSRSAALIRQIKTLLQMQFTELFLLPEFSKALRAPSNTQEATLARILRRNKETKFGKEYNFSSIRSSLDFRRHIPIQGYEEHRCYVEALMCDATNADSKKPEAYLLTSGTTGKAKFIPVSRETRRSFRRLQTIAAYYQHKSTPGIFSGKLLNIVGPVTELRTDDGVACGSMSGLLSEELSYIVRENRLLPSAVSEILDYQERYLVMAAIALCEPNITCFASANPSTFLKLIEVINNETERLSNCLTSGRFDDLDVRLEGDVRAQIQRSMCAHPKNAALLKKIAGAHRVLRIQDLWPTLRAIVTWTGGNCGLLIPKLLEQVSPETRILEMSYVASEFFGTIPIYQDPMHEKTANLVHAVNCPTLQDNYFEFIEPELWEKGSRETVLLHELEVGKRYYIVVTTLDGLYRYFINDIVEVDGTHLNTPTFSFVQKGKGVTSLTGEKLYEEQVIESVQAAARSCGVVIDSFIVLADRQRFAYVIYVESNSTLNADLFSKTLDQQIGIRNLEYAAKLKSGRIAPVGVIKVRLGTFELYKAHAIKSGQREGQFKLICLQYRDEVLFPLDQHKAV